MILLVNLWKQTWLPFYHLLVSSGLWLFHHPLCRLLLMWLTPLMLFFFPWSLSSTSFVSSSAHVPWMNSCAKSVFLEIIHPTARRISPSGGPHLCFKSTKSQMGPRAHLPASTKIASYISVPWLYWLRGRLHFLLSHTKYTAWNESPLTFQTVPIQSFPSHLLQIS